MPRRTEPVHRRYRAIMRAWSTDVGHNDIYHMIIRWMDEFKQSIEAKQEVKRFLRRARNDDELKDLVEDFIYGGGCEKIRKQFKQEAESKSESESGSDPDSE